MQLNPYLRTVGPDTGPVADAPDSTGAWILEDEACRHVLNGLARDLVALAGAGGSVGADPGSLYSIVKQLGFARTGKPTGMWGFAVFFVTFLWRALALTGRCHASIAQLNQQRRQARL
jgi:hypothetical protein